MPSSCCFFFDFELPLLLLLCVSRVLRRTTSLAGSATVRVIALSATVGEKRKTFDMDNNSPRVVVVADCCSLGLAVAADDCSPDAAMMADNFSLGTAGTADDCSLEDDSLLATSTVSLFLRSDSFCRPLLSPTSYSCFSNRRSHPSHFRASSDIPSDFSFFLLRDSRAACRAGS
ncbi:hypothetical protein JOL62DRAFT_424612 [Phyllosticta paracitricarpa]|uniref:Secreted protein n=1 Tax=Phyllosticta paracitricarpa TaxID=2016321 RepID=A0ABR1NCS7_9PEZI